MYIDQVNARKSDVKAENCEEKEPYYYELARSIVEKILEHPSGEQVDLFKYIQKRLADKRVEQNLAMQADHKRLDRDIIDHNEGTDLIASGL